MSFYLFIYQSFDLVLRFLVREKNLENVGRDLNVPVHQHLPMKKKEQDLLELLNLEDVQQNRQDELLLQEEPHLELEMVHLHLIEVLNQKKPDSKDLKLDLHVLKEPPNQDLLDQPEVLDLHPKLVKLHHPNLIEEGTEEDQEEDFYKLKMIQL